MQQGSQECEQKILPFLHIRSNCIQMPDLRSASACDVAIGSSRAGTR